ncbi:MAG: OmpA family protein, partial [Bacteroidota bacterium]
MKRNFLFFFILSLTLVSPTVFSGMTNPVAEDNNSLQQSYVEKGDKLMKDFNFDQATEFYKKAADRDTNDVDAWEKLGNAYLLMDDYKSAEPVYKFLSIHPLAQAADKFYYGQVLRALGRYDEAHQAYSKFTEAAPNDSRAGEFKDFFLKLKPFLLDNKLFELTPFEVNTDASEIGTAFYNDKIIFSSNRTTGSPIKHSDINSQNPYYDIYELRANDTSKSNIPKRIKGDINRQFNEGPATFSADGREMIFSRTHYVSKGTDRISKLGLYHADYNEKQGWTNVQPLPFNSYTYNVTHPTLSKDGTRLYFISDMPGSFGETDIYFSEKKDSTWSNAVNLGNAINTPGREMFPFIEDNLKLYFSSDSRVGLGGLDIYSVFRSNENWIYLTNLGAPVNTTSDDYGYVSDVSGKKGFIVSNRSGGKGSDDIYKFLRNDQKLFNLPVVNFDSSSFVLREDAKVMLDSVAGIMKANPALVIELSGHTDSRGTKEFNIYLGQERATACEEYLGANGIEKARIITS